MRNIDRYKRIVAEIILPDGRNLNQELVRAGWRGGTGSSPSATVLPVLEQEARAARRGLWADPSRGRPWEWRKAARAR